MFPRIVWRQRALVRGAVPLAGALLLAAACAKSPEPMSAHAASLAGHATSAAVRTSARDLPVLATAADMVAVVDIRTFAFAVPALTVPVGTTVSWTNYDVEPHTVTARDRTFASPGLEMGDTFTYRFDAPGTYAYYCALHPHITGQIVVQ